MIIENSFKQHDSEWFKARLRSVGGTDISSIITSKGKPVKEETRENFMIEKASQRLTGRAKPIFQSYEMKWGNEHEPDARRTFAYNKGFKVSECAMIFSDERRVWHISPDGIMPDREEGLEIKCPQLKSHLIYLEKGVLPTKYRLQVQSSLALTGWKVWWFCSYFPGIKPLIIPVGRDEKLITQIRLKVDQFLNDLDAFIERIAA